MPATGAKRSGTAMTRSHRRCGAWHASLTSAATDSFYGINSRPSGVDADAQPTISAKSANAPYGRSMNKRAASDWENEGSGMAEAAGSMAGKPNTRKIYGTWIWSRPWKRRRTK